MNSLHMAPRFTQQHVKDGRVADPVALSQLLRRDSGGMCRADFSDGGGRQFRHRVCFAALHALRVFPRPMTYPANVSPLTNGVLHVVGVGSEKQVIGPDICSIVTPMADEQSFWNWSVCQLKRHAMRRASVVFANLKEAVTVVAIGAGPAPAVIGLGDFTPEPFNEIACAASGVARVRTEPVLPDFFAVWAGLCRLVGNHSDLLAVCVARGAVGADYTVAPRSLYAEEWVT